MRFILEINDLRTCCLIVPWIDCRSSICEKAKQEWFQSFFLCVCHTGLWRCRWCCTGSCSNDGIDNSSHYRSSEVAELPQLCPSMGHILLVFGLDWSLRPTEQYGIDKCIFWEMCQYSHSTEHGLAANLWHIALDILLYPLRFRVSDCPCRGTIWSFLDAYDFSRYLVVSCALHGSFCECFIENC